MFRSNKLLDIATSWKNSLNPTEEQEIRANERRSVCKTCPSLKGKLHIGVCGECGCPISKKIYSNSNSCPLKKWKQ